MKLEELLKGSSLEVLGLTPTQKVKTTIGTLSLMAFASQVKDRFKEKALEVPSMKKYILAGAVEDLVSDVRMLSEERAIGGGGSDDTPIKKGGLVPDKDVIVNFDISGRNREEFFITDTEDNILPILDGKRYVERFGVSPQVVKTLARPVRVVYQPRKQGNKTDAVGREEIYNLNKYREPKWKTWRKENRAEWSALPESLPPLIARFLKHLIPLVEERRFLMTWIWSSVTRRSETCLILCGAPGSGKNRLKILVSALHGGSNTVDGKDSTLKTQFNSQLADNTLLWFDELRFTHKVTERIKEVANDTISIERKGVDATKSTEIYSSLVIANNYPRNNYLVFEDRKFCPLKLGGTKLDTALTSDEIDTLSKKMTETHVDYDPAFVAQIARACRRIDSRYNDRWPRLEYKGPMFWALCHVSLSAGKRSLIEILFRPKKGKSNGWKPRISMFQWSEVRAALKYESKESEANEITNPHTAKDFLREFRNLKGEKVFEVINLVDMAPADLRFCHITREDFFIKLLHDDTELRTLEDLIAETSQAGVKDIGEVTAEKEFKEAADKLAKEKEEKVEEEGVSIL